MGKKRFHLHLILLYNCRWTYEETVCVKTQNWSCAHGGHYCLRACFYPFIEKKIWNRSFSFCVREFWCCHVEEISCFKKMPGYYTIFDFILVLCNRFWLVFIHFIFYFPLFQPPASHKNIRMESVLELIEFTGALIYVTQQQCLCPPSGMQCTEFWFVPNVITLLLYKAYCSAENMNVPLFFPDAGEWENLTAHIAIMYFVGHCLIVKWHSLLLGA